MVANARRRGERTSTRRSGPPFSSQQTPHRSKRFTLPSSKLAPMSSSPERASCSLPQPGSPSLISVASRCRYQSWLEGFESLGYDPTKSKSLMLSSVDLASSARRTFSTLHPSASPRLVGLALGSFGATIAYQGTEYTGKFPASADEAFLTEFHRARLELFAAKADQVDFVAFETVPLPVEVRAIRKAVGRTWVKEKPFWIGLTAPQRVWPGGKLEDAGENFWGGEDPVPFA